MSIRNDKVKHESFACFVYCFYVTVLLNKIVEPDEKQFFEIEQFLSDLSLINIIFATLATQMYSVQLGKFLSHFT